MRFQIDSTTRDRATVVVKQTESSDLEMSVKYKGSQSAAVRHRLTSTEARALAGGILALLDGV